MREHRRNPYATMQNGLILRAIYASDYEPFHKNPDSITYESHYPTIEVELPRGAQLQSVNGQASTGDTVLLGVARRSTLPVNPFDLILGDRQSITINMPQFGVPASFKSYSICAPTSANTCPQNVQFASAVLSDKNQGVRTENHYSFYDWTADSPNSGVFLAGMNNCYLLYSKNVTQSVLSTLTISVARQTERESIPITFVVPVQKSQPTEAWSAN